jgi:F0F1-type ATP synthase assembly protein I
MAVIDNKMWREALIVLGRMSGWVATPVIIALFLGRWLDTRHGTGNFWFIAIVGAGFFISVYGIYREAKKYQVTLEAREKKDSNGNTPDNN